MEDKKMLDIIHNNCKKEQLKRHNQQVVKEIKKREKHYSRLEKILLATGLICLSIEILILVIGG